LLLAQFEAMIGENNEWWACKRAKAWRISVEAWLCRQGWITVRRNQKPNVAVTFPKRWFQN
jgi:hypothetical protein